MGKVILSRQEMQKVILSGIEKLNGVVGSTMGPSGRNVIIREQFDRSSITNDGFKVVENFNLEDEYENFGISLIKEASKRCNNESGDGTSSTILFCYYLMKEGIKLIESGYDPIKLRIGMRIALERFSEELDKRTFKVKTIDDIRKIATISGNNDAELGEIIANIYKEIGFNGIIQFEKIEGNAIITTIKKGFNMEKGYSNNIFINNSVKGIVEYSGDCLIWIGDASKYENCLEIIEYSVEQNRPLLIISDEIDEKLLSLYKANRSLLSKSAGKQLQMSCMISPSNDIFRKELLEDLAIYIDAKPIMKGFVGSCNGFVSSIKDTLIVNGAGNQENIDQQLEKIKASFDISKPTFYKDSLEGRINRLNGKLCILKIGSKTQLERSELVDRVEDITRACKSGIESGYFIGGGYTMLTIQKLLKKNIENRDLEVQKGIDLIINSLNCLLKQNLKNSGLDDLFPNPKFYKMVFNIKTKKWEKPGDTNVLEVNKVMKTALENAISLISTILLSDHLIF